MPLLMGIVIDRHGTYYARKKVPPRLQEAVARVLNNGKSHQVWLKRSLDTKDRETANRRAKPVLIQFDQTLAEAEALTAKRPLRTGLSPVEIKRLTEYHYARKLTVHDEFMRAAPEIEAEWRRLEPEAGPWVDQVPAFGLSGSQMADARDTLPEIVAEAENALASGDIGHISFQIDQVLGDFQINLDPSSGAYRELGLALLRAEVRALRAIQQRHAGEPIETPPLPAVAPSAPPATGATMSAAFQGWKRDGNHSPRTLQDFEYAIRLFGQLHGDMLVASVRKSHAREFREALREVPVKRLRTGKLRTATLPELAQWGREHPQAQKIAATTINKLLGGVQAVSKWASGEDGFVPDEWADPFAGIRIDADDSDRAPFSTEELQAIFHTPIYTESERPAGGQGEAAVWLPLLALFTGARLGELAGLRVSDVAHEELVGTHCIYIVSDAKAGRRIKTKQSARVIPLHRQLIDARLLEFVAVQAKAHGDKAWLFPKVAPGTTGARAFSKWFGRYIGSHGVTDEAKVFHSFRHNFNDALRLAAVNDDIRHALVGHAQGGVNARYGAKEMAARYRHRLAEAIAGVAYTGLDLSHLTHR
jgi:integrase